MKKKIPGLFLGLLLCLLLMPMSAHAADIASGTGWNLSDDGVLHITGAVDASGFGLTSDQKAKVKSVVTESGASISSGANLFSGYWDMTSADLSKLDTSNVSAMYNMFYDCSSLTSLDVSGFDTGSVTDMSRMFEGCSSLTSLDVSGFDTSSVRDMGVMFYNCSGLTSLDVSGFDTSSVTDMFAMFEGCSSLTSLDVSGFDTGSVTDMFAMFSDCSGLASLDVSGFDTSSVTDMSAMFSGCSGLTSLDVSGFDTGSVTDMNNMFSDCSSLTSLDVSGFDTGSVTDMCNMFYGCSGLTSLDVSGFDTGSVTDVSYMFQYCSGLASLDVSGFDTGSVTEMYDMFNGCSGLTSLDVSGFDTSSVTDMSNMFSGCSGLTSLGIRPDILHENADDIIAIRSPWQKKGSTDTYSTADELRTVTENVTLVDPLTGYTVTINSDCFGTALADKYSAAAGETVTLTAVPDAGYRLKEWQSSDVIVSGNTFTMPEKDVTVTAVFEADASGAFTVTFNANGGSVTPAGSKTGADGKLTSLPAPTRSGSYSFSGWYTAASGGTRVTVDKVYTADTTIYAHWTYTGGGSSGGGGGGSSYSGSSSAVSGQTYSPNWFCDELGVWRIKNSAGQIVTNAWLCDDVIKANGKDVWYLLGQDGAMVSVGLVQDNTGNFYSLETEHNGYFGMLRYKNGTYNCNGQQVYLTFNQEHNGSFGAVTNAEGLEKLKAIYGVTQYGIGNDNAVYTASF